MSMSESNVTKAVDTLNIMLDRLHAELAVISEMMGNGARGNLTENDVIILGAATVDMQVGMEKTTETIAIIMASMTVKHPEFLLAALHARIDPAGVRKAADMLEEKLGEVNPFAKAQWDNLPE